MCVCVSFGDHSRTCFDNPWVWTLLIALLCLLPPAPPSTEEQTKDPSLLLVSDCWGSVFAHTASEGVPEPVSMGVLAADGHCQPCPALLCPENVKLATEVYSKPASLSAHSVVFLFLTAPTFWPL